MYEDSFWTGDTDGDDNNEIAKKKYENGIASRLTAFSWGTAF